MRIARGIGSAFLVLFLAVPAECAEPDHAGEQRPARLDTQTRVELGYLLYLPKNYEEQEAWPLVLFLHGAGERGDDLDLVKKHGPPRLVSEGRDFPFILVSPQCPPDQWWQPVELTALLDEMVRTLRVDEDRVYVTGLSMGGFGTWSLAAYTPRRFAALAPICGGGEAYWAPRFAGVPVWAFHGARDEAVPLRRSQEMVDALRRRRGNVRFTIYPEGGHDVWTETYAKPEFYEWLLEQRRAE